MLWKKKPVATGDSHVARGIKALDNKDYQNAIKELEQAIRLGVESYDLPEIYTILGRTYKDLGRHREAIETHKRAIDINPAFHKAWNNLGIAYLETGRFDEAVQCFEKAVDLDPDYSFAQVSLAATYIQRNKPEQAIEHLVKAIELNPSLSEAHGDLALALAMIGKFQDAKQSLKQAIALGYESWQDVQRRIARLQELDTPPTVIDRPNIHQIIQALAGESIEERESAARSLHDLAKEGLDTEEGIAALRAAAHDFPPRRYAFLDSSTDLIRAATQEPKPEYIPVIVDLYATYNNHAKEAALALLTKSKQRAAAEAYMNILSLYARQDGVPSLRVAPLIADPRYPDVFLPGILDYADIPSLEFDAYLLCLTYLQQGLVTTREVLPYSQQVIQHYQIHEEALFSAPRSEGIHWMWENEYQQSRNIGALLLDLMGHLPNPKIEGALVRALSYQDPKLKCFAVCSLLRLGNDVNPAHILDVSRSAEMRRHLYQQLEKSGARQLFPEEFRTQAAFAESNMVNWLSFPSELGRVPDEIELMEVIGFSTDAEKCLDYYAFRFRTWEPHWVAEQGWLAGVSGPYLHGEAPQAIVPDGTFSAFEPWDSKTPEEHVRSICGILDEWQRSYF